MKERFVEYINDMAFSRNVHPVCLLCRRKCKQAYSFWSFQMPPEEFCDDFEEDGSRCVMDD